MGQAEIKTRGTKKFRSSIIRTEIAENHEECMSEASHLVLICLKTRTVTQSMYIERDCVDERLPVFWCSAFY